MIIMKVVSCPVCEVAIVVSAKEVTQGVTLDHKMSAHLDLGCKEAARRRKKEKEKKTCSFPKCKKVELLPMTCRYCSSSFCIRFLSFFLSSSSIILNTWRKEIWSTRKLIDYFFFSLLTFFISHRNPHDHQCSSLEKTKDIRNPQTRNSRILIHANWGLFVHQFCFSICLFFFFFSNLYPGIFFEETNYKNVR